MISKDVVARDTIRMIISDIKKYEIDERLEADDAVISTLINKTVKQRRDSIENLSASSMQDMGKLMGYLKPKLEGKANMSVVSVIIKELLA